MKLFNKINYGALFLLTAFFYCVCLDFAFAQSGKDGARSVNTAGVIVNEYTAITSNIPVGSSTITVASSGLNTNSRFTSSLSAGDLIMIIQMQGVNITHPDDTTYGEIISYNDCGNYELCQVAAVVNSNTISLSCATKNSYTATGRAQVVRVPRYTTLDVLSGGSITCPAWDGTIGGVLVIEADGNINIASGGSITSTGKGFRGGQMNENLTFYGVGNDVWPTGDYGGEKGEGVVGYQADYDLIGGRYCKGPPANGGGGANAHNAGGGGGGNAGSLPWNGKGMPDPAYAVAWNLEYTGFATSVSSGGGKGGYTFSSTNQNELVVGPLNTAWGGDYRRNNGGRGGRPLDYTTGRIFLGGGGGSGDQNDLKGGGGGSGGGLIYITSRGTVSGAGSITADGNNGINSAVPPIFVTSADGAGGGGAGGTVLINAQGLVTGLTVSATGGKGGNQNVAAGSLDAYGPGGGGGGGYIATTTAVITRTANGGLNGTTNSFSMTSFPSNGATSGGSGLPNENLPSFSFSCAGATICPNTSTTLTANYQGIFPPGAVFTWYSSPTSSSIGTGPSFTTPVLGSTTTYYLGTCPGYYRIPVQVTVGIFTASFTPDTVCDGTPVSLSGIATTSPGTVSNWSWNYGDASANGTTQNTTHLYTSPGTYPVTLTVNSSIGCQATFTSNIIVHPSPQINFSVSATTGCAPLNVVFNNTTTNTTGSYNWYFGDGGSSIVTSPGHSYTTAGIYSVSLIATNGNCTDTLVRPAYITVNPKPLASYFPSNTSLCLGDTIFFTNASTGNGNPITGYTWNFGDGTPFSNQSSPYHVYATSGSYQVRLITTTSVCSDDTIITINVNPSPVAGFTSNQTTSCGPNTISFNNTSTGSPVYSWNFGDTSPLSSSSNPSHIYSNGGTYTVTLIATQGSCADTLTRNAYIVIYPQPVSSFSTSNVCLGDTMHFNNLTSIVGGAISGYTWNFGDGSPLVNTPNANHVYATAGTYQVRLTATTIHCTDDTVITVVVNPAPQVNFSSSATTGCGPTTITFSNTSTGASSFTWNFGDGTSTSSLLSPSHTYNNNGAFTVTLIAAQGTCIDTITRPAFVSIYPKPISSFSTNAVCFGDSVFFTNLSAVSGAIITSYLWNYGDGSTLGTSASSAHYYATPGGYMVNLTVNTTNCSDDTTITVNVIPSPTAGFTTNLLTGCGPTTVSFTNTSSGGILYNWNFGDGSSGSTLSSPSHLYSTPGVYAVTLIAQRGTCNDTLTMSNLITINTQPFSSFSATGGCVGDSVHFVNLSTGAPFSSLQWNFGDGFISADSSPAHLYAGSGSFNVTLSLSNGNCLDDTVITVNVFPSPIAQISAPVISGCSPFQVNFSNLTTGSPNYHWDFGDGNFSTLQQTVHTYQTGGNYVVEMVASEGTCSDTAHLNISVANSPTASFIAPSTVCLGSPAVFQNTSSNGSYSWNFGDGTSPIAVSTPTHTFTSSGSFFVSLTVNNNGCIDSVAQVLVVNALPTVNFTASATSGCDSLQVALNSISSGGNIFSWTFGDGSTGTGASVTHNYNASGIYTVDLTASATTGCSATRSKQNFITVRSSPVPSITTGTQNICLDDCVSFQGASTGSPISWSWNLPGARPSTAFGSSTGSVCYSQLGNYPATLTVNDGYCSGSTTSNNIVRVNNCYVAPIADFIVSDSSICSGSCLSFVSMSLNATGWRWSFPGATPITSTLEQPAGICYSTPGTYAVSLIASNPLGVDTITLSNLIVVSPPPIIPTFSQTGNTLFAPLGYQYQWYFNNVPISGANNVSYTATLSGNYSVEITDANGCTSNSSIQHVSLVGVNELEGITAFNIFPNPVSNILNIEISSLIQQNITVSLFDEIGRDILFREVTILTGSNTIHLDVTHLAAGTYFISVNIPGSVFRKVIKF